jgi:hypothetical protein
MSIPDILSQIDVEIAQLQQARALITGAQTKRKPGRPVGSGKTKKKRVMSPEGRARLVAAVKARWARARQKKAGK